MNAKRKWDRRTILLVLIIAVILIAVIFVVFSPPGEKRYFTFKCSGSLAKQR